MKLFAFLVATLVAVTIPAFAEEAGVPATAVLFAENYPLTRSVLAADFPADLEALEQSFTDIDSTEISPVLRLQRIFVNLTALRKKYSHQVRFARADLSALVVLSLADFYRTVQERDGATVCGRFATDGAGTLYTLGAAPGYASELDRQSAAYFAAVVSSLEDPDVVEPVRDDDLTVIMSQVISDGHPASYVSSIAAGQASDPDLCPALSAYMQAMLQVEPEIGQRARADLIQNVTGY